MRLIFDGAATKWPGVLADPNHQAHRLYASVTDVVAGACGYCAGAFAARQSAQDAHVHLIDEYEGHPSIRRLVTEGYEVITF